MSFALVTTLSLLPLLCAISVCTLITIWTWALKYPTSSVHVHIICATSTTSAGIFPQQQRNVSSTPWLRLDLTIATLFSIGLYRENAIAIESEARDPFGGDVYYVTMQITFPIPEIARNERNLHCDVVHITTKWVSRLVLDHAIAAIQTSR